MFCVCVCVLFCNCYSVLPMLPFVCWNVFHIQQFPVKFPRICRVYLYFFSYFSTNNINTNRFKRWCCNSYEVAEEKSIQSIRTTQKKIDSIALDITIELQFRLNYIYVSKKAHKQKIEHWSPLTTHYSIRNVYFVSEICWFYRQWCSLIQHMHVEFTIYTI